MDYIHINKIKAYGYVGFFEEERTLGQWFCVDFKISVDLQPAASCDDLTLTVNYAQIVARTQKHIETSRVKLIETLAAELLNEVLAFDHVWAAEITLTKLAAPIPNFSGTVGVQMSREKSLTPGDSR